MRRRIVAKDGSGDFTSIQAAVDDVRVHQEELQEIFIKNGLYEERVIVPDNKPMIRFVGESREHTIISYGLYAKMKAADGRELGTFGTAVFTVAADDVRVENVTIRNTAGYGEAIGQAVAVYASGDRLVFDGCRMLGNQDTLYTAKGRQYYKSCFIEGHVDFIFGAATAVFEECEISSLRGGYIAAPSTTEHTEYGYIFRGCRLTGPAAEQTVFLARPWRPFGQTVFIDTWMDAHIKAEGWDNWRNPDNERTARFAEYGSSGPGGGMERRAGWAKRLTDEEAAALTAERIFGAADFWKY
ncbi:pectinesterase family protein [Paenibacillus hamazuiensis]|uniref:pectinesterase family protein n=1 Tax=Paenibacillus hamazuiensis TaxID=2936508 RepID=UPI0020108C88|nr:pectinesterase family protein [Paenibacillus hamazuiensis]